MRTSLHRSVLLLCLPALACDADRARNLTGAGTTAAPVVVNAKGIVAAE